MRPFTEGQNYTDSGLKEVRQEQDIELRGKIPSSGFGGVFSVGILIGICQELELIVNERKTNFMVVKRRVP